MTSFVFLSTVNGQAINRAEIPVFDFKDLRAAIIDYVKAGARISGLPAWREDDGRLRMVAVLSMPASGDILLGACDMPDSWRSLTPDCPSAHWFEREIAEIWQVMPEGHPWLKPIRFQPPRDLQLQGKIPAIGITGFFSIKGEESHEVAVGPVHAGIIEPGHFRFLCHGETVYHLEISLGYQHRGVERAMTGGPGPRSIHYMETLAGDTTIGHATAYCRAVEALSGIHVPPRAEAIRAIAAELERIANHTGDLGALAGDIGYLPTMSYCGRIRGDVLNMTAILCGNRFGRGLVRPSGTAYDLDRELIELLITRLNSAEKDLKGAVEIMFDTPSVLARFEGTGALSEDTAREIGLVGPAARATGLDCDVRREFPYGMYRFAQVHTCTWTTGDCFARAYVRWLEIKASIEFIRRQLLELPEGPVSLNVSPLRGDMLAVSLAEGWRGEICHVAATDSKGRFAFYKVIDPSFHNWFGLALALRNQQISDFPLCNKSFNLSYCGHDL
ncbi:MAG: NADH-quinone oxidoreductase subunit C [Deltaproteobacteria bacterium]|nr:NADH-quinone oxidoreductase subunit C [Deltaproteobacteria bacterium]